MAVADIDEAVTAIKCNVYKTTVEKLKPVMNNYLRIKKILPKLRKARNMSL